MIHLFRRMDQRLDRKLAHLWVQEDVKLIHDTERSFQLFAESQQESHRREASLSTAVLTK
jgi:hypothetical protein